MMQMIFESNYVMLVLCNSFERDLTFTKNLLLNNWSIM
jgi:hypothetical protein